MRGEQMITPTDDVSAPINNCESWEHIEWNSCNKIVFELQMRIVKAVKESRWGKVKALQRLLTRSFSGKALAVKRVTENRGKTTAGVDGKVWLCCMNRPFDALPLSPKSGFMRYA